MKRLCEFAWLACVGIVLAASCGSNDSLSGRSGTGGMSGGTGGAGCEYQHYFAPGCGADVAPACTGAGGACYSLACGCDGRVLTGCQNEFSAPYAYKMPVSFDGGDPAGMTCDPTSNPNP